MKSIVITTLAIILSSTSFSQVKGTFTPKGNKIVVGWDEKELTISSDIISKDEFVVGDLKHAYFFNEKAELTETKDAEKGGRFYFYTYLKEDTTVNVLNDKAIVSVQGQTEKITIDFNESEKFSPKDNIVDDVVGYTGPVYEYMHDDQDYFYNAEMYMSISKNSHPHLNGLDGNVFHTFLRFVKIDRNLKTAEVKYGLIDKIKLPKSNKNIGRVSILGYIKNKVIVQFRSYSYKESEKNKLHVEYWSFDLDTGEEVLLKELDKTYNTEVSLMKSNTSCSNEKYALDTFSWLEFDNVSKSNAVKFQVFGFNKDLEFIDQIIDVPSSEFSLASISAPETEACLGANDQVFVYIDVFVSLKKHIIQKVRAIISQQNDEINICYAPRLAEVTNQTMNSILSFKKWENEELINLFGMTREELEYRMENIKNFYFFSCTAKQIDGKLYVFKVKYTGRGNDEFLMTTLPSEIEIVEVE